MIEAMILFALLFHMLCSDWIYAAPTPEVAGKVVSLSGKVSSQKKDLSAGDSIYAGDVIQTAKNASAKILLTDKTVLDLGSATEFKVDEYVLRHGNDRNVSLSMNYGKVRAAVNQAVEGKGKYRFRTRTATMGVRGTEFIVQSDLVQSDLVQSDSAAKDLNSLAKSADQAQTQITVVEGKVEVTQPDFPQSKALDLTPGKQLVTAAVPASEGGKTSAPEIKQLNSQEMQKTVSEAKVTDKTFTQAVVIDSSSGLTANKKEMDSTSKSSEPGNRPSGPANKTAMQGMMALVTANMQTMEVQMIKPGEMMQPQPFRAPEIVPVGQPVQLKVIFTP